MSYRADIDGLRSVAIIPVVFYHAGVTIFSGGFVGVDIFFVISGYLITSLIDSELSEDRFSLIDFYERRIRRIFPALFSVIGFCAIVGWYVLAPNDYKSFGQSVVAASLFVSNILFWRQSGYFDAPTSERPLLHTWSLSVEEQFYASFPLYLILARRLFGKSTILVTSSIAVASFLMSLWAVKSYPTAAFYLSPARAWELMLGSLAAMGAFPELRGKNVRNGVALTGVTLIAISVFMYTKSTAFPGAAALLPTFGALFVIWSGTNGGSIVKSILSKPPFVFIGKISYSLYLWHFCLFAFANHLNIEELTPFETGAVLFVSFACSILSWRFIERPFRRRRELSSGTRPIFAAASLSTCAAIGFGLAIIHAGGAPNRFSPDQLSILAGADDFNPDRAVCLGKTVDQTVRGELCKLGIVTSGDPTFALWGDSQAEALRAAVDAAAVQNHQSGIFAGADGCAPLLDIDRSDIRGCGAINKSIVDFIISKPTIRTVLLAGRWGIWAEGTRYKREGRSPSFVRLISSTISPSTAHDNRAEFLSGLEQSIRILNESGRSVWIVGPVPEIGYNVPRSIYNNDLNIGRYVDIRPTLEEFYSREEFVLMSLDKLSIKYPIKIISPQTLLCHSLRCEIRSGINSLYSDDNHLSNFGSRLVSPVFARAFE